MKADLKTIQDLKNPDIKECPYCGCDEFYYIQYASGKVEYHMQFNGEEADNGEMNESLRYSDIGKFAYCAECRKRVFRFKE